MDDSRLIDGEWHPEAFAAGTEARQMGRAMNGPDNPYRDYGERHWMLKSFRAGWCDRDQSLLSQPGAWTALQAINDAMEAVERAGASPALTDATFTLAKAREQVSALEREARSLVGLLAAVGEQTEWRDGEETDRVFSWGEFAELRRLLSSDSGVKQ